jgi:hydrogenase/urease accessory protein HupE
MAAALATLWILFSVWLLGPHVGMARRAEQLVGAACAAELVLLLAWSYGTETCDDRACAPLAQAAGVAARIDLPVLSVVLVLAALRTTTARRMGGPSDTA